MARPLGRFEGQAIAEQIGVVRLQDDATATSRALIQGTQALAETSEKLVNYAQAQYIADFELDQRKKATELRAAHINDPEAFRKAWTAHTEGTMSAVPAAFRNRAAISIKGVGESGYESVFNSVAAKTEANAVASWKAVLAVKEAEYLSIAAGARQGKYTPDQVETARVGVSLHLEDGVRLKVMDEKGAAIYRDQAAAKAAGEGLGEEAKKRYFEALKRPDTTKSGETDLDRALTVLRKAESSERNLVGPKVEFKNKKGEVVRTDHPYGLYQIMGANIPSWTQEVLGKSMTPEEFMKDEEAQHKVARAKFGQFVKEHGLENAYAIWASGRPLAQSAEDKDLVFGTKVKDTVAARMKAYGEASSPPGRARKEADGVLEQLRTDPMFASLRSPTSAATIEAGVRRAITDAEADYRHARAENNESYSTFITRLSNGFEIDVGDAQSRAAEARRLGDGRSAARWDMIATKGQALASFSRLSFREQSADLQAAFAKTTANPKDDAALFEYQTKAQLFSRAQESLKRDGYTYATNVHGRDLPPPPPVDFSRPDATAFKARRDHLAVVESRIGMELLPFSSEEMRRLASTFNTAQGDMKASIAASLNDGLGTKLAARVVERLAKEGNVDRASIFAMSVAPRDPVLARDVFDGLSIMAAEKKPALQNEEQFQTAFNDKAGKAFVNGLNPGEAAKARDAAYEGVRALIAKWAFGQGKLGQKIDMSDVEPLITRALGEVVRHNGKEIFPPRRDMNQRQFDETLARIGDRDAPPFRAADGSPVSITRALRSGVLENVGDGRYAIRFGENYYLTQPGDPSRPFILDRGFFEGVEKRIAAEDMGAFTGGEGRPNRSREGRPWRPDANPAPPWVRE